MRTKEAITLIDVAKAAGVSQATVSRVLNKHPRINRNTRDKVYAVINQLGYDTSSIERKVMKKAMRTQSRLLNIGVLLCPLPEQTNMLSLNFFSEILNGIQLIFNQKKEIHHTISTWHAEEEKFLQENNNTLSQIARQDGIIIMGNPSDKLIERINQNGIKTVLTTEHPNSSFDTVDTDNIGGGRLAAKYLIDNGAKNIGFLDSTSNIRDWKARKSGVMLETIERLGLEHFFCQSCPSTEMVDVITTLREWIDSGSFPECLILPYADSVFGAELVLTEKGLKCPDDVSIISFDRPAIDTFYIKPTCCEIFPIDLGKKAALRLIELLNPQSLDDTKHHIMVPVKLVEGNSVKKAQN